MKKPIMIEKATENLLIRVTEHQKELFRQAGAGNVSAWAKEILEKAANFVNEHPPKPPKD